MDIDVRRKFILQDAILEVKKRKCSANKSLKVNFINAHTSLSFIHCFRRELFCLLVEEAQKSTHFHT